MSGRLLGVGLIEAACSFLCDEAVVVRHDLGDHLDSGDGGGRAALESGLPGLSSYKRVSDYRLGQIAKLTNHKEAFSK